MMSKVLVGHRGHVRCRLGWPREIEEEHLRWCAPGAGLYGFDVGENTVESVSMSSAEAEYRALIHGAQEGLFLKSLGSELGLTLRITLESDAASAIAAAEKQGLMKFKH